MSDQTPLSRSRDSASHYPSPNDGPGPATLVGHADPGVVGGDLDAAMRRAGAKRADPHQLAELARDLALDVDDLRARILDRADVNTDDIHEFVDATASEIERALRWIATEVSSAAEERGRRAVEPELQRTRLRLALSEAVIDLRGDVSAERLVEHVVYEVDRAARERDEWRKLALDAIARLQAGAQ